MAKKSHINLNIELNHFLLFSVILILLPKRLLSYYSYYIEIKVNQIGNNQILSDEYNGDYPYVENVGYINNKNYYFSSTNNAIRFEWRYRMQNFSYMFNNLKTITYIYIYNMFSYYSNLTYMFKNCINLQTFSYSYNYRYSQDFEDLYGMFYNCLSLQSFSFNNFNFCNDHRSSGCYSYNRINLSYMFYNCTNIQTITNSNSNEIRYITDMSYMFYNCSKLNQINLNNFYSNNELNMSNFFYNCQNLNSITPPNYHFIINDTREMFYNCTSLTYVSFYHYFAYSSINMSRMFYNCNKLISVNINNDRNSYFYPSDTSFMFYNCTSLISLYVYDFNPRYIEKMSYFFYNCKQLRYYNILSYNYSNDFVKDMRGIFQNCESIVTLDLTNFYTPNVKIMWDMFNGCSKLQNLYIQRFSTSNVIDMQSMFSGCRSLISLNLNHFNTKKVQYMNEMFQNCEKLQYLYLSQFSSDSLSSMYRMFYNCASLKYLNIFNLVEDVQSIFEMFEGTPNHFTICIKDKENIHNIYDSIYDKIIRDCSYNCYGFGNERNSSLNAKDCCALNEFKYKENCYITCPGKTKPQYYSRECVDFFCTNYYNYDQNICIDNIPDGFYQNDTIEKTIDKCHEDCKTCDKSPNDDTTNCLSCNDTKPYLYLGNCYTDCHKGYFNDSNDIKKCICHETKCKECTIDSLKYDLCVSCNDLEGYYEKSDDNNSNFTNCYKDPEEYYLNLTLGKYYPCYNTCKFCNRSSTDKRHHYCTSCNIDNSFSLLDESNPNYMNCFPECKYYFYFDNDYNYFCTNTSECPQPYPYLIDNTKQCNQTCNDKHKYQFRRTCFEQCPIDSKNFTNETGFYCNVSCPFERPFEMVKKELCVSSCTIMERINRECITNYDGDRNKEVQDMILSDFQVDIVDTFDYKNITENHSVIYEEKNIIYEITSTNCTYMNPKTTTIDLGKCEDILKKFYPKIVYNESLYIFKFDAFVEGKAGPKVEYEVYYPLDKTHLQLLDLSICEDEEIFIGYPLIVSEDELYLYNIDSDYYNDLCYPYTNSKGADVTLNDRRTEYANNNKSICDENCKYYGYDNVNQRLICSCEVKSSISIISHIEVDKNKLYKYIDLTNMINFKVMKCFNLLFSDKGFKNNIGLYSFFPTIISYFAALFLFILLEFRLILDKINEIIASKKLMKLIMDKKIELEKNKRRKKHNYLENDESYYKWKDKKYWKKNKNFHVVYLAKKFKNQLSTIKEEKSTNRYKKYSQNKNKNIKKFKKKYKKENSDNSSFNAKIEKHLKEPIDDNYSNRSEIKTSNILVDNEFYKKTESIISSPPNKKLKYNKEKNIIQFNKENAEQENEISNKNLIEPSYVLELNKISKNDLTEEDRIKISKALQYNDNELNDLGYKKAFQYDHRTFFQYYISLLFTKHILLQIFNKKDYNSYSIKVLLFFFNFSSCYAINALFFNDETMHQIYEDEGVFNFVYQIPQIAYSTLISYFVDNITTFLALTEENVLQLKRDKNLSKLNEKRKQIIHIIKIKVLLFFIVSIIFISIFWYYLGCFCAVYKNTQYHLIKDTIISLCISYITPLGSNIITSLLRKYSLKEYNKGKRVLFRLSKILQEYF